MNSTRTQRGIHQWMGDYDLEKPCLIHATGLASTVADLCEITQQMGFHTCSLVTRIEVPLNRVISTLENQAKTGYLVSGGGTQSA
jgi:hypothetical protein